jgi:F-box/WD-40 domain protein 5
LCGLEAREVLAAGAVCSRWLAASRDGPLWRRLLCRDFSLTLASTRLRPAADGWLAEYRRLIEDSPCVLASELRGHSDEVLHVSFSHAGDQFVTCSLDGFVLE